MFEAVGRCVHGLSSGSEGTDGQYLDLLRVSDASASVDDLLSCVVEVLRKSAKLLYFSFDERVAKLLYGAIDDRLVRLSRLEDPLVKRIEGGLGAVARSCAEFDCEHGVSFSHGKMGAGADVIEYEVYVFGFALVVIRVVDGRRDAKPSVGPILDKGWSGVSVARSVIDDVLVGAHYHNWRSGRSNAVR